MDDAAMSERAIHEARRDAFQEAAETLLVMIKVQRVDPSPESLLHAVQELLRAEERALTGIALAEKVRQAWPTTEQRRTWLCECCGELRDSSISASSAHGLHDRWVCSDCKRDHGYWPIAHEQD